MSKNDVSSFRIKAFVIKACFFAAALVLIAIFILSFRIKNITISGNELSDTESIASAAALKRGAHMYSIDKAAIADRIISENPYVSSVTIRRRLPSSIIITVTEDKPVFFVPFESKFLILSGELRVLDSTENPQGLAAAGLIPLSLPKISKADVGGTLVFESAKNYSLCNELLQLFASCDFSGDITSIDISNKFDVKAVYKSKYTIVFGSYTDLEKKLKFCKKTIGYVEKNMPGVSGTIYASTTSETSFVITGTAG